MSFLVPSTTPHHVVALWSAHLPVSDSLRRTADNLSEQLLGRVPEEWHTAHQELIQDDAHGPPVYRLPVALAEDHLWCDVLRCPTYLHKWRNEAGLAWGSWGGWVQSCPWVGSHLLVHKLSGILLNVTFIQVGGHAHETDLGQAEVRQLDVAEGGDEQAVGEVRTLRLGGKARASMVANIG